MEEMENNTCKVLLLEFLDFIRFKIENNSLTTSELQGLFHAFAENINLQGTAEDIAKFYKRTPQDVRTIVNRKMLTPPQRKVHYSMNEFIRIAPPKWREK